MVASIFSWLVALYLGWSCLGARLAYWSLSRSASAVCPAVFALPLVACLDMMIDKKKKRGTNLFGLFLLASDNVPAPHFLNQRGGFSLLFGQL